MIMYVFSYLILMVIILNLAISTLISMKLLMHNNSGSRYEQWIKPIIYVAMVYTEMSVSFNFIGVVAHEYLFALLIFYLVDKNKAVFLVAVTPIIRIMYIFFVDGHVTLVSVIATGIVSILVIVYLKVFSKFVENQLLSMLLCEILIVATEIAFSSYIPHVVIYSLFNQSTNWIIRATVAVITVIAVRKVYLQVTSLQEKNLELKKEVSFDKLTGFLNYKKFEQDILMNVNTRNNIGIAIIDLDYFKKVNDTYGHDIGNQILQQFSIFLRKHLAYKLKQTELGIYRYGGEEIVWMFDPVLFSDVQEYLEIVQAEFEKIPLGGKNHYMSFSVGISFSINHHFNLKKTFDEADNLLYESKKMVEGK
ncbi:GGDEF domain-containing protein [Leuconostoc litchii]|uniref:GGDEF domain-containing protein n=1 Tax=Leuconostoc litchii TaxID=1981069 RepID=UPI0023EA1FD5|nr:GGDEF domain-containing protein [Leuconostoc litchii]GMA70355.1 GGDEF domain-containing protein [Leuconostoc litchii]